MSACALIQNPAAFVAFIVWGLAVWGVFAMVRSSSRDPDDER